jgi:LysM repeat protein
MERDVATVNRKAWKVLRSSPAGILVTCGLLLGGCVVLEEKYDAEKARSLNFQRLLAQEERRAAELESEVKRTKRELLEFEARNRELLAQIQSIREQMTRLQEETEAVKEAALLERKAMEEMRKLSGQTAKPKKSDLPAESPPSGDKPQPTSPKAAKGVDMPKEPIASGKGGTIIHVVKPGETLFRISRRYGIETEKLRQMNKLPDDIIEVGQRLIVGTE